MQIEGAVALVTGGASGLGEATVRRLVEQGAKVVIADLNADKAEVLCKELGDAASFAKTDVRDADQVQAAVDAAAARGALRATVHCAGTGWVGRTINKDGSPHDPDPFRLIIDINLIGTFNVMTRSASAMSKNDPLEDGERGVIINTASVAAFDGQVGQLAYAASKGAVVAATLPAARDLAPVGVRVCTIAPGTFDTPLMAMLPEPARQALVANIPFPKRLGEPKDYALLAEQIIRNPYLNGETIRLDGAIRMPQK